MANWYSGFSQPQGLDSVLSSLSPEKAAEIRAAMKTLQPPAHSDVLEAAESGNIAPWTTQILRGSLEVDFRDKQGLTLMHHAVWRQEYKLVTQLLDVAGCPVDVQGGEDQTPLMIAVAKGDLKLVKMLLDRGADVEAVRKDKCTAVLVAAQRSQLRVLLALHGRGASMKRVDVTGNGLVHWAAYQNDIQTLRVLKCMELPMDTKNTQGQTPLHQAALTNSYQAIQYLLSLGCNQKAINSEGKRPIDVAESLSNSAALRAFREHGRESVLQRYFSVCFLGYVSGLYLTYMSFVMESSAEYLLFNLILSVLFCIVPILYFSVRFSDPGFVPPQGDSLATSPVNQIQELFEENRFEEIPSSDRYCLTCHLLRPMRSKHCRHCNRCIPRQDLHCDLVGVCVGERNRRRFVAWLVTLWMLVGVELGMEWVYFDAQVGDFTLTGYCSLMFIQVISEPPLHQLTLFLSICVFWYLSCHVLIFLYSITYAQTVNEVLNRHRYVYLFSPFTGRDGEVKMRFANPFYKSMWRSWTAFLAGEKQNNS